MFPRSWKPLALPGAGVGVPGSLAGHNPHAMPPWTGGGMGANLDGWLAQPERL